MVAFALQVPLQKEGNDAGSLKAAAPLPTIAARCDRVASCSPSRSRCSPPRPPPRWRAAGPRTFPKPASCRRAAAVAHPPPPAVRQTQQAAPLRATGTGQRHSALAVSAQSGGGHDARAVVCGPACGPPASSPSTFRNNGFISADRHCACLCASPVVAGLGESSCKLARRSLAHAPLLPDRRSSSGWPAPTAT